VLHAARRAAAVGRGVRAKQAARTLIGLAATMCLMGTALRVRDLHLADPLPTIRTCDALRDAVRPNSRHPLMLCKVRGTSQVLQAPQHSPSSGSFFRNRLQSVGTHHSSGGTSASMKPARLRFSYGGSATL